MILAVSDNKYFDEKIGYIRIAIEDFNDLAFHPYIQSQDWEVVVIDVSDNINRSYVTQIIKSKGYIVIPRLTEPLTARTLLLMFEIYPDMQVDLMAAFKNPNKEVLAELINKLKVAYKWEIYI